MRCEDRLVRLLSGLDEASLRSVYGSEYQCHRALLRLRWGQGWVCSRCGHGRHAMLRQGRVLQCNLCKRQVSLTAGTIFENSKLPLPTWFSAIHLLSSTQGRTTSAELARRLGLRQGTAWLMKQKLLLVCSRQLPSHGAGMPRRSSAEAAESPLPSAPLTERARRNG